MYTFLGASELRHPHELDNFDAIVFCGGMGNQQGKTLGVNGLTAVKDFVESGGGYVSSCAGSYLATSSFDWSLHVIDSQVIDYKHWYRGTGDVDCELTPTGKEIFGNKAGLFKIHYANGPLLAPISQPSDSGLQPFTPLAYFRSDMAKTAPGGVMPNTPAIIAGNFGKGRVICFSPHPEYTEGLGLFIPDALHWVTRQPVLSPAKTPAH